MAVIKNKILKPRVRRVFDPANKADRAVLGNFLRTLKWGGEGCPFELEDNWEDIPTQCVFKLARHELDAQIRV